MTPTDACFADRQRILEKSNGTTLKIPGACDARGEQPNHQHCDRPSSSPDTITILKTMRGIAASKRIAMGQDGRLVVHGFNLGWLFSAIEGSVSNIVSLSAMLKVVEAQRDCLLIRGAPLEDLDCSRPVRRQKANFQTPPI